MSARSATRPVFAVVFAVLFLVAFIAALFIAPSGERESGPPSIDRPIGTEVVAAPVADAGRELASAPDRVATEVDARAAASKASARVRVVRAFGGDPVGDALVRAQPRSDAAVATFEITSASGPDAPLARTTDADGIAEFRELTAGSWLFTASHPGMCTSSANALLSVGPQPLEVHVLMRDGFALSGRVVDGRRQALPDAEVVATVASNVRDLRRSQSTRSDAEGRFEFVGLPDGDAQLVASAPTHATTALSVHLPLPARIDVVLADAAAVIEGRVVDARDDAPIPEAVIEVRTTSAGVVARGVADGEGRFRIGELPSERLLVVVASKSGWQTSMEGGASRTVVPSIGGSGPTRVVLRLVRGGTVRGRVLRDGEPVGGASVTALTAGVPVEVRSDDVGRFVAAGLPDGPCLVHAERGGEFDRSFPWEDWVAHLGGAGFPATSIVIRDADAHEVDLDLVEGATVSGTVEDDAHRAVVGARVFTMGGPFPSTAAFSDRSDARGRFRLSGVPPDREIALWVEADGFVGDEPTRVTVASGATQEVRVRVVAAPRVRGRVVGEAGGGLPRRTTVQVALVSGRRDAMSGPLGEFVVWQTAPIVALAADGTFDVALAAARGEFAVRAGTPGGACALWPATRFEIGRPIAPVLLELPAGACVEGRVVDAHSLPLAGVGIDVTGGTPGRAILAFRALRVVTGANGAFRVGPLAPGTYEIGASSPGMARATVRAQVPDVSGVTLVLEPELQVAGFVVDSAGAPIADVQVTARLGRPDYDRNWYQAALGAARTVSGGDGRFTLSGLIEGDFILEAWRSSDRVLTQSLARVDGVAAGSSDVELRLPPDSTLSGSVVDDLGQVVPRAELRLAAERAPATVLARASTNENGRFELLYTERGPFRIRADARSGTRRLFGELHDVDRGATALRIVVREARSLRGRVVDADGRPVAELPLMFGGDGGGGAEPVRTGARGEFVATLSTPGVVDVRVDPLDARATRFVLLDATGLDAVAEPAQLRLVPGVELAGRVRSRSGRSVGSIRVLATTDAWRAEVRAATSGAFEFPAAPAGAVTLAAIGAGGFELARVSIRTPSRGVELSVE